MQITAPDGVVIKRYIYDAHGNIMKEIDGEGYICADNDKDRVGILYQYNAIGWLTEKREPIKQEEGKILYRLTRYSYDPVGNRTKEMRYRDFQTKESAEGAIHVLSLDMIKIIVASVSVTIQEHQYNINITVKISVLVRGENYLIHKRKQLSMTMTKQEGL